MDISKDTFITMLERMASFGSAPDEGCSIFGVGYEDAFARIEHKYLNEQFTRGTSSEKFVIGPFGSGKTHFLRQLMEIARDRNCVTSEVVLNKDIDFSRSIIVYSEVIRELRVPFSRERGIKHFLSASLEKVKSCSENKYIEELFVNGWISGIDKKGFKLDMFGKVIKKALMAIVEEDDVILDMCCRWLEGDINDRRLSGELGIAKIDKSSNNLYAKRLMMSLFQFIRHAGFQGSLVCFDEAEQGLSVDKKKTDKILSMLMSGIESITNLQEGSALVVYALTPDLVDKMKNFAALQQRIMSPRGRGFFDGNTLAPLIELWSDNPLEDINRIGNKLADVFYELLGEEISVRKEEVFKEINEIAISIVEENISGSSRREMVKGTCSMLLELFETGKLVKPELFKEDSFNEPEV
ncbi:MAG: BREX system ATP-binding domain-containing protein [Candidatus Eremiobacterota bacterium]